MAYVVLAFALVSFGVFLDRHVLYQAVPLRIDDAGLHYALAWMDGRGDQQDCHLTQKQPANHGAEHCQRDPLSALRNVCPCFVGVVEKKKTLLRT